MSKSSASTYRSAATGDFSAPAAKGGLAEVSLTRSSTRKAPREQKTYMRSSSNNPLVESPSFCEFPSSVASSAPKGAWAPNSAGRPINRRGYFSPSFWVEQVEKGGTSKTSTYLDYGLTNGFHKFWKDECEKEQRFAGPPRSRKTAPVSRGPQGERRCRESSSSPRPTPLVGRMSLARLTQSRSTPAFWPAGRSPVITWKP
mmetsp:Transcript_23132/g.48121  ORF Transcript_23132/g.48121 Transcript_23132/m.48121 type:complete len:201 (-) Transcript_23132:132-734(-)